MAFLSFQLHPRPGSVYVRKPHQPWPVTGTRPDLENQRKEPFSRKQRQPAQTTSGQHSYAAAAATPHELRPRQEHNAVQNSQPLGGCFCLFSSKMTLFRGQTYDFHFLSCPAALVWRLSQALPHTWACLLLLQAPQNISQWKELFLTSHLPSPLILSILLCKDRGHKWINPLISSKTSKTPTSWGWHMVVRAGW